MLQSINKVSLILFIGVLASLPSTLSLQAQEVGTNSEIHYFLDIVTTSSRAAQEKALKTIEKNWKPEFEIMALEVMYFGYSTDVGLKMALLLQKKTGQNFGLDFNKWYEYVWNKEQKILPEYAYFKSQLHKSLDAKFENYFQGRQEGSLIRLDEIRWGGVQQDGIPPLRNPPMIPATVHEMGTSGFLYRSNKLMYDQATQSLWSTLEGKPVVGPLVGKGIQMEYLSVVTTTWGEWKKRHPDTQVLSVNTGYQRDYGEGVAYQAYFADDNLMFNVPSVDRKLKNKQSILAIRLPEYPEQPLAISVKYLKKNPVYQSTIGDTRFVVFTDKTGANRVYDATNLNFKKYDQHSTAIDLRGDTWTIYEDRIENSSGKVRPRIHTFNAFWFGWQAAYPDTKLIK